MFSCHFEMGWTLGHKIQSIFKEILPIFVTAVSRKEFCCIFQIWFYKKKVYMEICQLFVFFFLFLSGGALSQFKTIFIWWHYILFLHICVKETSQLGTFGEVGNNNEWVE
jgi:hypothetical protein